MARITKLRLSLKTGSQSFSGTDARVYLVLVGSHTERVYLVPTQPGDLETGKLDIYPVECPDGPDVDDVTHVLLVNGMNRPQPAWRILWARLEAVDANGRAWLLADAMVERWLESSPDRAPLAFLPLKRPVHALGASDVVGPPVGFLKLIA